MKRGLVIGKFLPVHEGHVALINFATTQCDEVIVSLSAADTDTIPASLRLSWLSKIFEHNPSIKCFAIEDNFDDETLPIEERTKIWAAFIQKTYPKIDFLFSSEEYGESFARHLHAEHKPFDPGRKQFPVSGTRVRENPFRYWDFLPGVVKPYFVKKICFYGPESTGKSYLAKILAQRFNTEWVPEVARELITSNDFSIADIIRIGHAQTERVIEKATVANKILFCDTDVITTQVYCRHYLHTVPDVLYALEKQITYDHCFLFDIDVPWVADDMRDLGQRRKEMFDVFKRELDERKLPYTLVKGDYRTREHILVSWLKEKYDLSPNV